MKITYEWHKGPWQWVDSGDDEVIEFVGELDGFWDFVGVPRLETVWERPCSCCGTIPNFIATLDGCFDAPDANYPAIAAFPDVADALIQFMEAVAPHVECRDAGELLRNAAKIEAAWNAGQAALIKAGAKGIELNDYEI